MAKKQEFSQEQVRAADPTANVWVQANAGTGKTSVLVQRLLRILFRNSPPSEGCPSDSEGGEGLQIQKNPPRRPCGRHPSYGGELGILCLTYTNAAAAEMRNRILAALREWATADDDELREKLRGVAHGAPAEIEADVKDTGRSTDADLDQARAIFYEYIDNPGMLKIRTIHGFCEEILRRFPIEAGIPPAWRLLSGADQTRLQRDTFTELVNERGDAAMDAAFARIMDQVSEYSLDDLLNVLTGQYRRFFKLNNDFKNKKQFIDTISNYLNITSDKYPADAQFYSASAVQNRRQILDALDGEIATSKKPAGYLLKVRDAVKKFVQRTTIVGANNYSPLQIDDFNEYKFAFLNKDGTKNPHVSKKEYLADEQELVYALNQENINREIHENSIALYDLSAAFARKYREIKLSRQLLDFDDLILYTNKLFSDPATMGWVLSQLDIGLHHILVDEAQDTSPEQWDILNALSADFMTDGDRGDNPHTFFVVGDTKQSIYSFQGADPAAFAKSKSAIRAQIKNDARQMIDVPLAESFRSTEPILSAVDCFFSDVSISSLSNFINNSHKCFRAGEAGLVELHPLSKPAEEQDSAAGRRQFIAEIAGKIENILKNENPGSNGQPVKPSDIMILVQRRHPFTPTLIAELQKRGIPVAGSDRIILPDFPAIRDLLNLVRFCMNTDNDYALAVVLKSPLFRMNEPGLYKLLHNRGSESLFNRINGLHNNIHVKLQQILEWSTLPPYSFFMRVLNTDNRREKMVAASGRQIIDPLEEFLTICLSYERTQSGGLSEFIEWFITGGSEITRDIDAAAGVRVVTTHGAKGLESPIVFLIDAIRNPHSANAIRIAEPVPIDDRAFLWQGRAADSERMAAAEEAQYKTQLAEYYRLLYVAMTRARDRLYIYGFNNTKEPPADAWHTQLRRVLGAHPNAQADESGIIRISNE